MDDMGDADEVDDIHMDSGTFFGLSNGREISGGRDRGWDDSASGEAIATPLV
jgi:hypothetical protein